MQHVELVQRGELQLRGGVRGVVVDRGVLDPVGDPGEVVHERVRVVREVQPPIATSTAPMAARSDDADPHLRWARRRGPTGAFDTTVADEVGGGLRAAGPHERPDARQRDDEPGRRERSRPQISPEAEQLGERDDDPLESQERHHEGSPRGQATKTELCSVDGEQPPEQQVGAEREDESEPSQGQRLAHQGASAASGAGVATPVRMSTTSASPGEPSDRTAATTSAIANGSTRT